MSQGFQSLTQDFSYLLSNLVESIIFSFLFYMNTGETLMVYDGGNELIGTTFFT